MKIYGYKNNIKNIEEALKNLRKEIFGFEAIETFDTPARKERKAEKTVYKEDINDPEVLRCGYWIWRNILENALISYPILKEHGIKENDLISFWEKLEIEAQEIINETEVEQTEIELQK
jgi:arsenate reductase-like glutaredoxin family protein